MAPSELFASAWPVVRFAVIDSTNEEARRRAVDGDVGPCWLVTDAQTAGRGRLGREWTSPPGNLFATALFSYPRPPAEATLASFAAGLAVIDAARTMGVDASQLKLKWPNDVLVADGKLAGILIETGTQHGRFWMAAGFGVNVEVAPERPDRLTSCLAALPGGRDLTAQRLLPALDLAYRERLWGLLSEGFEATRRAWLECAAYLGKPVAANGVAGVMTGLADDGALILQLTDGSESHVRAGEISLLS